MGKNLVRALYTLHLPSPDGLHVIDKLFCVQVETTDFQTDAVQMLTELGK
jgi:hypothetical protein